MLFKVLPEHLFMLDDASLLRSKESESAGHDQEESKGGAKGRRRPNVRASSEAPSSDVEIDHYTLLGVSRDSSRESPVACIPVDELYCSERDSRHVQETSQAVPP